MNQDLTVILGLLFTSEAEIVFTVKVFGKNKFYSCP